MSQKSKKKYSSKSTIKSWPKEDRPREKLLNHGAHLLTNTELLAIILQTGVKGESAIDLSRKVLQKFKSFSNMSNTDLREWDEFKGLGRAKIATLKAVFEIARRFNSNEEEILKTSIKFTEDIVSMFKPRMRDLKNEVVKVILLDSKNCIIDTIEVSKGTPTGANPIVREVISKALQKFASALICIHNHPSGDSIPSKEDENFTSSLKEACKLVDVRFLDHIIFGEKEFYSFDKCSAQKY